MIYYFLFSVLNVVFRDIRENAITTFVPIFGRLCSYIRLREFGSENGLIKANR